MTNDLVDLVERGLDPAGYDAPVRLLLREDDIHHGIDSCVDAGRGGVLQRLEVSPLRVENLCDCWISSLTSPAGDELYHSVEVGRTLRTHQKSLERPLGDDLLQELTQLQGVHLKIRGILAEEYAPVQIWAQALRDAVEERILTVRASLQTREVRQDLLLWCGRRGYADMRELLDFPGVEHVLEPSRQQAMGAMLWIRYAESITHAWSREDLIAEFAQTIIDHGAWETMALDSLDFTPTGTMRPDETLREYVLREWQEDVTSFAPYLVHDWEKKMALDTHEGYELLAIRVPDFTDTDTVAGRLHGIKEAWRVGEKNGQTIVVVPPDVATVLRKHLQLSQYWHPVATLQESDTQATLETAISLWEADSGGALRHLSSALDAARCV